MTYTNKFLFILFSLSAHINAGLRDQIPSVTLLGATATSLLSSWSLYQWHTLNNRRRTLEKAVGISELLQALNEDAKAEEKELGPDWQVFYITERVYKIALGEDNPYCQMLLNLLKREKFFFMTGFFSGCAGFVCWKQLYNQGKSLPFTL